MYFFTFSASSIRSAVGRLSSAGSLEEAEERFEIDYYQSSPETSKSNETRKSNATSKSNEASIKTSPEELSLEQQFDDIIRKFTRKELLVLGNKLYHHLSGGQASDPSDFFTKIFQCHQNLAEAKENPHFPYKLACCFASRKENGQTMLPIGALKYNVDFFSSTHISQVKRIYW